MTSSQSQEIFTNNQKGNILSKLIERCNNESDIDKKIQLFYKINSMFPISYQVDIPSLLTDDYINIVLYRIHQNIHKLTI
ncbi:MAG TPA: hypothetical protein VE548_05605 [Nitrososphaeraceae archaeon]|nr:hypothetical protein [Nitrososphaeraceae archaeon]